MDQDLASAPRGCSPIPVTRSDPFASPEHERIEFPGQGFDRGSACTRGSEPSTLDVLADLHEIVKPRLCLEIGVRNEIANGLNRNLERTEGFRLIEHFNDLLP